MPASAAALPSYKRPPVVEVSFGAVFSTAVPLQTQHLGRFYARHAQEYPKAEDAIPIIDAADLPTKLAAPVPIPLRRILARAEDDDFLIQIQDSRVYLNWRQADAFRAYPRYERLLPRFLRVWSDLSAFAAEQHLGEPRAVRWELTYVNQLPVPGDVIQAVEHFLKPFQFSKIGGERFSRAEAVSSNWRFPAPALGGAGSVTLNTAEVPSGKKLTLTLACSGAGGDSHDAESWFGAAHEWIVRGFTDLTSEIAQQEWGKE